MQGRPLTGAPLGSLLLVYTASIGAAMRPFILCIPFLFSVSLSFSLFSVLFCFFCCRFPSLHSLSPSPSPSPLSLLPTSARRHLLASSTLLFFSLSFYSYQGHRHCPVHSLYLASGTFWPHVLSCLYCYPSLPPTNSSLSLKQIIKNPSAVFNRSGRASSNLQ